MAKRVVKIDNLSQEEQTRFKEKYDYIFFDMDGTLQSINREEIPGAPEAVSAVAASVKEIYVFTDSCLYSRDTLANKLRNRFPFLKKDNMVSSSFLISESLKKMAFKKKIYVLGAEEGIVKELKHAGFEVITDPVTDDYCTVHDLYKIQLDPDVGAVVVAADLNFTFMKLMKAVNYLVKPDVLLLASQHYLKVAYPGRNIIPAAAALVKPMSAITKREPMYHSKGSDASLEYINSLGYDAKRCLFVGDSLDTDIKFGNKCGMDTLLVLSGLTTEQLLPEEIEKRDDDYIPTYVANSIVDLKIIYK